VFNATRKIHDNNKNKGHAVLERLYHIAKAHKSEGCLRPRSTYAIGKRGREILLREAPGEGRLAAICNAYMAHILGRNGYVLGQSAGREVSLLSLSYFGREIKWVILYYGR
jgi:hypothetical protein